MWVAVKNETRFSSLTANDTQRVEVTCVEVQEFESKK
jgi:hypothetical protein